MTNDGINTLAYDGESHVTSATNGSAAGAYVYDGNGLRVQKCLPSCGGSNPNTTYLFSGSEVIAEYDNGAGVGSPSREYIYAGGAILAKIDSSGTKYYHQDQLSNRLITDSSGNTLVQQGHFPYGENWYAKDGSGNNIAADKWQFTTYERDSESENDYAQARYNVSGLGRFSSPDPIAGSASDPQSLNRYSYVRNMPSMLIDPFGTCPGGVAQNQDPNQTQDAKSGGGPWAPDPSESAPEPQVIHGHCAGGTPCQYTWSGCGDDGQGGGGSGDGGFGPGGIGSGAGDYGFSFVGGGEPGGLAFLLPPWFDIFGPSDPCSVDDDGSLAASGSCLGAGDAQGGHGGGLQQIKSIINLALHVPKLGQCLNQIFGPGNILTNQNLPLVDTTQNSTQLGAYINGLNPNTPAANPANAVVSTFAVPVPASGKGTVLIASDYFYSPTSADNFLAASYLHETANILAIQLNSYHQAANPAPFGGDHDTGAALEECIFGGSVQHNGTVKTQ